MSGTMHVTMWCDYPACNAHFDGAEEQSELSAARAATKAARAAGWFSTNGKDYCGGHTGAAMLENYLLVV